MRSRDGVGDDLRPEYDLRRLLKGGITGKYARKDWEEWDRQIKADSAAGKLDFLVEEALAEKRTGRLRNP
ncbi:MAG: hypothetical protein NTW87_33985 [Planctomycetota bacterium]|nr:hypothetical protein [Planctomycetota bacterium]